MFTALPSSDRLLSPDDEADQPGSVVSASGLSARSGVSGSQARTSLKGSRNHTPAPLQLQDLHSARSGAGGGDTARERDQSGDYARPSPNDEKAFAPLLEQAEYQALKRSPSGSLSALGSDGAGPLVAPLSRAGSAVSLVSGQGGAGVRSGTPAGLRQVAVSTAGVLITYHSLSYEVPAPVDDKGLVPAGETTAFLPGRPSGVVWPGSVTAVLGPVGSGKSTLLDLLTGAAPRHVGGVVTGSVLFNGTRSADTSRSRWIHLRRHSSLLLPGSVSVRTVLQLYNDTGLALAGCSDDSTDTLKLSVQDVLTRIGLLHKADMPLNSLSCTEKVC